MSDSWHSYPSIFALGHRAIRDLLTVPVTVEEKVDGSQFSFGVFPAYDHEGYTAGETVLRCRSKGCVLNIDAPEKMFTHAVETAKRLQPLLKVGWTYRGEYLAKPGHNALIYSRIPAQHIILFDINDDHESYLSYEEKVVEAGRLGLEVVPRLHSGLLTDIASVREFLAADSILGGQKIEGVVVKPIGYSLYGPDKKALIGKFVSEAFKEVHAKTWGESNPKGGDIIQRISERYTTPARWIKAIQHLREAGQIEDSPKDIGKLIGEIPNDIKKECEEELKEALFVWAWPHIRRSVTRGFPEYYKERLLKQQFEQGDEQKLPTHE